MQIRDKDKKRQWVSQNKIKKDKMFSLGPYTASMCVEKNVVWKCMLKE